MRPNSPAPTKSTIPYFAYGANLSTATLQKRGIKIDRSTQPGALLGTPARVCDQDIVLAFAHRGGYATLLPLARYQQILRQETPRSSSHTHTYWYKQPYGVVYYLTKEQIAKIAEKEIGYRRQFIAVSLLTPPPTTVPTKTNEKLDAVVFVSSPLQLLRGGSLPPSERYRNVMVQGAMQHNLNDDYIAWLASLPVISSPADIGLNPAYSNTLSSLLAKTLIGLFVAFSVLVFRELPLLLSLLSSYSE